MTGFASFVVEVGGVCLTSGFQCCLFIVSFQVVFLLFIHRIHAYCFWWARGVSTLVSDPQGLVRVCQHPVELRQDLPQKE